MCPSIGLVSIPSRPDAWALSICRSKYAAGNRRGGRTLRAGKSTSFQLLLRFYDPERGAILHRRTSGHAARSAVLAAADRIRAADTVLFGASARDKHWLRATGSSDEQIEARLAQPRPMSSCGPYGRLRHVPGDTRHAAIRGPAPAHRDCACHSQGSTNPVARLKRPSSLDAESERLVQTALAELMRGRRPSSSLIGWQPC